MLKTKFHLEVSYNETTGDPTASYLRVREGEIAVTKEVSDGVVFADYGEDGLLLGIELLGPCKADVLEQLARPEPEAIRHFLREAVRRPLAFA
jgi:hypothetical protein